MITFDLLFKFRFTVVMLSSYNAWLPVYSRPKHRVAYVCAKFYAQVVRLQVVVKSSRSLSRLLMSFLSSQLAEVIVQPVKSLFVCLCVCVLTRIAQITTEHRDS